MLGNQCLVFAFIAIIANYSHALPCKKTWYLIKKAWGVVLIKIPLLSLLILSVIAWARYFKQNYSFRASLYRSITPHLNMKHFADIVTEGQVLLCRKQVVKSNEMGILYLILEQGKKSWQLLASPIRKGFHFHVMHLTLFRTTWYTVYWL